MQANRVASSPPLYSSPYAALQAPRTGVGLRADGAVMLLVVDGIETEDEGVDLWEFAEVRGVELPARRQLCLPFSSKARARQPCGSKSLPLIETLQQLTCSSL